MLKILKINDSNIFYPFKFSVDKQQLYNYKMNLPVLSLATVLATAAAFTPSPIFSRSSSSVVALQVKTGPAGVPAKTKEEDLELTMQIILDHMNAIATEEGVDDSDDE